MNRRQFLQSAATAAAAVTGITMSHLGSTAAFAQDQTAEPTFAKLPRWRGFNLLEKFMPEYNDSGPFKEQDFDCIKEFGFDFVRLPCSYLFWASQEDFYAIREEPLKQIDDAIRYGRDRGIHMNLNMHRIPGYCINPPKEPTDLFKDEATLKAACHHWAMFAERYKGIPSRELSFDLMNEPPSIDDENYLRVHGALADAIRAVDPDRLIIADGKGGGHSPVSGASKIRVGMSTRGYQPFRLSHYKASWVGGSDTWPVPTWPLKEKRADGTEVVTWDKERLRADRITQWKKVEAEGVGIHIGEWGVFNQTPHDVSLAWMQTNLELFREAGWGWALWNLRGSFGVLNSERSDVQYEDYKGMKLDRKMLELLKGF